MQAEEKKDVEKIVALQSAIKFNGGGMGNFFHCMDKIAEFGCVQITIPVCMQARWHDGKMEGMMAMYGTLRGFLLLADRPH